MVALNKFPAAFRRDHEAKRFRFLKNDRPAIVIRSERFGLESCKSRKRFALEVWKDEFKGERFAQDKCFIQSGRGLLTKIPKRFGLEWPLGGLAGKRFGLESPSSGKRFPLEICKSWERFIGGVLSVGLFLRRFWPFARRTKP